MRHRGTLPRSTPRACSHEESTPRRSRLRNSTRSASTSDIHATSSETQPRMSPTAQSPTKSAKAKPHREDWLPHQRPDNSTSAKVITRGLLSAYSYCDWFLSRASAMEKQEPVQARIFTKFYLFLRDFIPQGLTGRFAHIRGSDVMNLLLSHLETTPSRHRVAKQADMAFSDLESWMGSHRGWEDALRKAGNDVGKASKKKQKDSRAPGLLSPAGTHVPGVPCPPYIANLPGQACLPRSSSRTQTPSRGSRTILADYKSSG